MMFQVLVLLVTWLVGGVRSSPARRDFDALERRRRRAGQMFARGATQAQVAQALEVSRQSVSRWHEDWSRDGTKALKAAGRAGRMPKLTADQLGRVDRALRKGPRAHGFAADLWTLDRAAKVIEAETGVRYHRGHVWKLLTDKLGWSRQRPARRAVERDEEAIARWVRKDWPRIKRGLAEPGSSSRTSPESASSRR